MSAAQDKSQDKRPKKFRVQDFVKEAAEDAPCLMATYPEGVGRRALMDWYGLGYNQAGQIIGGLERSIVFTRQPGKPVRFWPRTAAAEPLPPLGVGEREVLKALWDRADLARPPRVKIRPGTLARQLLVYNCGGICKLLNSLETSGAIRRIDDDRPENASADGIDLPGGMSTWELLRGSDAMNPVAFHSGSKARQSGPNKPELNGAAR